MVKYGTVLGSFVAEDAKKLKGKLIVASNSLEDILEDPDSICPDILEEVYDRVERPFLTKTKEYYRYIREKIEEPSRFRPYTYREAQYLIGSSILNKYPDDNIKNQITLVTSVTLFKDGTYKINDITPEELLENYVKLDGQICGKEITE